MSIKEQLEGLKTAIQMIQTSINDILNDLVSKLVDKLLEQEENYDSSDSEESEYNSQSRESDRYVSTDGVPSPPPLVAYRLIQLPDEPVPVKIYKKLHYDQLPQ